MLARKREVRKSRQPQQASVVQKTTYDVTLPEELYKKAKREVLNEKAITPFTLAQKLGISISASKRILRRLESEGIVKLYSPGKRCPIYIPVKSSR